MSRLLFVGLDKFAYGLGLSVSLAACSTRDYEPPPFGNGGSLPAFGGATSSGGAQSGGATVVGSGGSTTAAGGLSAGGSSATSGGAASGGSGTSTGGASTATGGASTGGATSAGGNAMTGTGGAMGAMGGSTSGSGSLGNGMMMGSGKTDMRYQTVSVSRDGVPYTLITNGWGPGFGSHTISWNGTSFTVENMTGTAGPNYQPASYPSLFCGKYSVMQVPACGLPASLDSLMTLRTGWRWAANGNAGEYNAAYDIWLGDGSRLQAYLMVWLRDPPGQQPAGSPNMQFKGISVTNAPGVWDIWNGSVNNLPIVNYVRTEGMDSSEIEFDVMDFVRDAKMRNLNLPGTSINAVAIGFEIWEGPVMNLETKDFYVKVN